MQDHVFIDLKTVRISLFTRIVNEGLNRGTRPLPEPLGMTTLEVFFVTLRVEALLRPVGRLPTAVVHPVPHALPAPIFVKIVAHPYAGAQQNARMADRTLRIVLSRNAARWIVEEPTIGSSPCFHNFLRRRLPRLTNVLRLPGERHRFPSRGRFPKSTPVLDPAHFVVRHLLVSGQWAMWVRATIPAIKPSTPTASRRHRR